MANTPETQLVIDIDNIAGSPLITGNNSSVIASMSSDLTTADGSKLLVKQAIKEYVDRYIQDNSQLDIKWLETNSDIISADCEYDETGYPISYMPQFMEIESENAVIKLDKVGLIVENQGITRTLRQNNITISRSELDAIIATFPIDIYEGFVNDPYADGSEESKYITEIQLTELSPEIMDVKNSYRYYRTANGEVIRGYMDINSQKLLDITRAVGNDWNNEHYKVKRIGAVSEDGESTENVVLLNHINVFIDLTDNSVKLIRGSNTVYDTVLPRNYYENDIFFNTSSKEWVICEDGLWTVHPYYIYLGDLIYFKRSLIGVVQSDLRLLTDDINNIELRVSGNTVYTYSDKTFITVFNKLVEFNLDRLKWDLSDENTERYLYIDGDGKTWVDKLRPRLYSSLNYYGHYYHYWRCLALVSPVQKPDGSNEWIIKEKF